MQDLVHGAKVCHELKSKPMYVGSQHLFPSVGPQNSGSPWKQPNSTGQIILWWEMYQVAFSGEKHRLFSNTCLMKPSVAFSADGILFLLTHLSHSFCLVPHSCTPPCCQGHSDTCFASNLTICEFWQPNSRNHGLGRNVESSRQPAVCECASAELGWSTPLTEAAPRSYPLRSHPP